MHLQPCFKRLGYRPGDLPESERASDEVLSLPIFPGMTREEIARVCEVINGAGS
jgi:dTDP-4-amino-4,6-dideoxygalactose transaminase